MNNTKILPVKYPPITTYSHHANLLSVILNNEEAYPWFINNYIQLFIYKDYYRTSWANFYNNPFYWDSCPWIFNQRISREFAEKKWGSIIKFVTDCIDIGYYVYLYVDIYYIAQYNNHYLRKHIPHDIFIYGYDLEKQIFNAADFFENHKYSYRDVEFIQFEQSYYGIEQIKWEEPWEGIKLVSFISRGYNFDLELFKSTISDYILAKNRCNKYIIPQMQNEEEIVYGREIYTVLREYLEVIIHKSELHNIDIRPFHLLYDHKKGMLLKIKFLELKQYLDDASTFYNAFSQLEKLTYIVRNMIIKSKLSRDQKLLLDSIDFIVSIGEKETETLESLLDNINFEHKVVNKQIYCFEWRLGIDTPNSII